MNLSVYPVMDKVVVFTMDGQLYALPITNVIRVIHALEVRELPKAPEVICGIINVKGEIFPVVDMRKRFGMVSREIDPEDNFILADTGKRRIALWVAEVPGVREVLTGQYSDSKESLPFVDFIRGVVKIEGEIILIYDLEQCLNLNEEKELEEALSKNI